MSQSSPFDAYLKLASLAVGGFALVPAVVAMRVPIMAVEALSPQGGRPETVRAVVEKMAAIFDGIIEAQMSLSRSALAFWPRHIAGRTTGFELGLALQKSLEAAAKPASRRVRANHRRLSQRKSP